VKGLSAITAQLALLDMATVPVYVVNGLKASIRPPLTREPFTSVHVDSPAGEGEPVGALAEAIARDFS